MDDRVDLRVRLLSITAIAALVAVSFTPWWHSQQLNGNVWSSSTIWCAAIIGAGLALIVWCVTRSTSARVAATAVTAVAALAALGYAVAGPIDGPAPGPRRYIDYLPGPIVRDHLFDLPGVTGPRYGEYLGLGLLVAVAVAMALVLLVQRRGARELVPA